MSRINKAAHNMSKYYFDLFCYKNTVYSKLIDLHTVLVVDPSRFFCHTSAYTASWLLKFSTTVND